MKRSKRYLKAVELSDKEKYYSIAEALEFLKKAPKASFDETVELSFKLNVDPKKSNQMIRDSVILPHGIGKKVTVLAFCEPEKEAEAKEAGADFVGGKDLIDKISKENWLEFDSCVATPTLMREVSKLGRILGPRGLMPSAKTGTVTDNVAAAVKELKMGKLNFRMDKFSSLAVGVGKISFSKEKLAENIEAFLKALRATRPSMLKGELIRSLSISTTMSPAVKVKL
jgi:large subunit ribosomal protein L1